MAAIEINRLSDDQCYICEAVLKKRHNALNITSNTKDMYIKYKCYLKNSEPTSVYICTENKTKVCKKCRNNAFNDKQRYSHIDISSIQITCLLCKKDKNVIDSPLSTINSNYHLLYSKAYMQKYNEYKAFGSQDHICMNCNIYIHHNETEILKVNLTTIERAEVSEQTPLFDESGDPIASGSGYNQYSDIGVNPLSSATTRKKSDSSDTSEEYILSKPKPKQQKTIVVNYPRTAITKCSIFTPSKTKGNVVISKEARRQVFQNIGIFISAGTRCNANHLTSDGFLSEDSVKQLRAVSSTTELTAHELTEWVDWLRVKAKYGILYEFTDESTLTEDRCNRLLGISKENFFKIVECIKPQLKKSQNRSISQALAVYLYRMKTGLSEENICSVLSLENQQEVSNWCKSVRDAMFEFFVPQYLGINHISRHELVNTHTSNIAKKLLSTTENELILIMDGTYLYIEKSANYHFQRDTYSMQKHRNLLKPMMLVTTTGYIVDCYGLYAGNKNDATITKGLINDDAFRPLLGSTTTFVLDRGFRDVLNDLKGNGCKCYMPAYLSKSDKQFSTQVANKNRQITKIRWVVEVVNGHLKSKWQHLDNIHNISLNSFTMDVKIGCALLNMGHKPLVSDSDDIEIAIKMNNRIQDFPQNDLFIYLNDKQYIRQKGKDWKRLEDSNEITFPLLSMEDMKNITFGSYQLKQSLSYIAEHLTEDGKYVISVCKPEPDLLRARIQSRHTSSKQYHLFIRHDLGCNHDSIKQYYCQCKSGMRTVGCCAHIASVIFYLGYARHTDFVSPAVSMDNVLQQIPAIVCESEDSEIEPDNTEETLE